MNAFALRDDTSRKWVAEHNQAFFERFGAHLAEQQPPEQTREAPGVVPCAHARTSPRHMRSEADDLLPAIDEALRIGREGGVPVEIFHLKAGGRRNWPAMRSAIEKIGASSSLLTAMIFLLPVIPTMCWVAPEMPKAR